LVVILTEIEGREVETAKCGKRGVGTLGRKAEERLKELGKG